MTARDDAREFERWRREVCEPADAAAEPQEFRIKAGETATWRVAPIPGGWACSPPQPAPRPSNAP